MAPSQIFILWSPTVGIDSVHSTIQSATSALLSSPPASNLSLCNKDLLGGTITITNSNPAAAPRTTTTTARPKAKPKANAPIKPEADEQEEEELKAEAEEEEEPIKPEIKAEDLPTVSSAPAKQPTIKKPTKTPAEQRAANASKPAKASDSIADLPPNIQALLKKGGKTFEGQTVIVTGVPPTLGRKNTERLVEAFGAHLGKSLSKKTGWVVVGNEAGPKKLVQIEELGIKTLDEGGLVEMLEKEVGGGGSGGVKRESSADVDEEEEEEEVKPKVKRARK